MFKRLTSLFPQRPKRVPPEEQLAKLDLWAAGFAGLALPLEDPLYWNWKISCGAELVNPPAARPEHQGRALQALLNAAGHLTHAPGQADLSYFRVAVLVTFPDMFSSEVTAFYDRDYYLNFRHRPDPLPPERLTERFDITIPAGFEIDGTLISYPLDEEDADLPGAYRGDDGKVYVDEERWTIGQAP